MMIVVDQAMTLKNLLLVYFPISFLLLIRMSMNSSTNGSRDPFITCESTIIVSNGASGISMKIAATNISRVYKR